MEKEQYSKQKQVQYDKEETNLI